MPDFVQGLRRLGWVVQDRLHHVQFRIRWALGLVKEDHRVTVMGFWCNDTGCYPGPDSNGIPDLELLYFVECYWCGELGNFIDPDEALRHAYEHSPKVDRDLFHRSQQHIEEALREQRRRQEQASLSGAFTTFGPIGVGWSGARGPETRGLGAEAQVRHARGRPQ